MTRPSLTGARGIKRTLFTGLIAALAGCSDTSGQSDGPSPGDTPVAWVKGPAECYWELPNSNGSTRLAAWLLTDLDLGTGTALAFADHAKFPNVPISDELEVRLVADQDPARSSTTRGFHPEGQGAYMLSTVFGPSQRLAMSGANEISIEFAGRIVASVTAEGFPTLEELSACDRG